VFSFSTWSFIISALLAGEATVLAVRAGRESLSEIYSEPRVLPATGLVLLIGTALIFSSIIRFHHPREFFIFLFACLLLLESGLMLFHPSLMAQWLKLIYGEHFERASLMALLDLVLAGAFLYLGLFVY
jgi:hypothetical protein